MFKYFLFFLALVFFTSCSSDNATDDTVSVEFSACSLGDLTLSSNPTSIPMLVVLINYNDINISSTESTWSDKIFGNNEGELNHYYNEISNSQFQFSKATELNGIASVYLDKNHPNIPINNFLPSFDSVVHPDLASALNALDDNISFDTYDTNGDKHIQADELLITFIVAGYEDAYEGGHTEQGIWAHQNCTLSENTPLLDNNETTIMGCANGGNFALFGERHNADNPHDATIGIIAHELGHSAFGLPDLYNTFNQSSAIGYFGLMGTGTWTYSSSEEFAGQTPVHMSAWSKLYNGWTTPDNTIGSKVMNATSLNSYNTVIIEDNEKCYLLENRDNSGYDRGLFALSGTFNGGLAIWGIDESKTTSNNIYYNNVNTDTLNKGVDLVEAQVSTIDYGGAGDANDLFYDGNNNSFTSSNANITNISVPGSAMTLNVN